MTAHSVLAQSILIYCIILSHSDDGKAYLLPAYNAPDAEQDEGTVYKIILYITILACAMLYVHA